MDDYLPLLAGLVGALIGSLSSVITLVLQARYQQERELRKLAIELAMEDFKFRVENESDRIHPVAAPVIVGYWNKMATLVSRDELTPGTMRDVLFYDAQMKAAMSEAYREWQQPAPDDLP